MGVLSPKNIVYDYALHKKWSFFIEDFFSKCDQIRRNLGIWPHLLTESLMENFIFCAVVILSISWSDFVCKWLPIQIKIFKNMLYPANIYLLKVNNRNTRKRWEIWSKLTIKTPEGRHWPRFSVFIVNFEHFSNLFLLFLLLTLKKKMLAE